MKNNLEKSTILLGNLLNEKIDGFTKLDIMIQIKKNLEILKAQNKDISNDLVKVEELLDSKLAKFADPTFIESIKNTLNQVMKEITLFLK